MERTRECGLIWWREGMHGWAIRAVLWGNWCGADRGGGGGCGG